MRLAKMGNTWSSNCIIPQSNVENIIHTEIGEKVYKDIIKELSSDRYEESDYESLSQKLNISSHYQKLFNASDKGNKEFEKWMTSHPNKKPLNKLHIPIAKIFERWVMENPDQVSKKTLHYVFSDIPSMRHLTRILNESYVNVPATYSRKNSPIIGDSEGLERNSSVGEEDDKRSASKKKDAPFIHLPNDLRYGRHTAEELLKDKEEGSWLIRTSVTCHGNFVIVLKLKEGPVQIYIEAVTTGVGTKYRRHLLESPDKESIKLFENLKDLINYYSVKEIYRGQKLGAVVLPTTENSCKIEELQPMTQTTPKYAMDGRLPTPPTTFNFNIIAGGLTTTILNDNRIQLQASSNTHYQTDVDYRVHLSQLVGVDDEESFLKLLGERATKETIEKLIRLKEQDKLFLPSVTKVMKATCLLQYDGNSGTWHGTGFLATITGFSGVILFSAGHNFEKNGFIKDFDKFQVSFNNPDGVMSTSGTSGIVTKCLSQLIDDNSTLVITYNGKQLIKQGRLPERESVHIHQKMDYFALVLGDPAAADQLTAEGLTFLSCASDPDLNEAPGEPLITFGYPGIPEGNMVSTSPKYPLRFSYGTEETPISAVPKELKDQRIFYNLDTKEGASGSEVIGKNYTVKGIHIRGLPNLNLNGAQTIKAVKQDLQSLGILP